MRARLRARPRISSGSCLCGRLCATLFGISLGMGITTCFLLNQQAAVNLTRLGYDQLRNTINNTLNSVIGESWELQPGNGSLVRATQAPFPYTHVKPYLEPSSSLDHEAQASMMSAGEEGVQSGNAVASDSGANASKSESGLVVPKGCRVRQESLQVSVVGGQRVICTAAQQHPTARDPSRHPPCWTYGLWVECGANSVTVPYDVGSCSILHPGIEGFASMLKQQPHFDPQRGYRWQKEMGGFPPKRSGLQRKFVLWQPLWSQQPGSSKLISPLSGAALGIGPWITPTRNELFNVLKGRNLYFFGDSIAGQQCMSAALLILCGAKGRQTLDYTWGHRSLHIASIKTRLVNLRGGSLMGFDTSVSGNPEEGSYYINREGKKIEMRKSGQIYRIDLEEHIPRHPSLIQAMTLKNLTLVINVGRWFEYFRTDLQFFSKGERILKPELSQIFHDLVCRAVAWFELNLQSGSYVIWMGSNGARLPADVQHPVYCGSTMDPGSKPIWEALRELKPKRNFFIDFGCPGSSPGPLRRKANDIHWMLPGAPDLMNLFVFRYMKELQLV